MDTLVHMDLNIYYRAKIAVILDSFHEFRLPSVPLSFKQLCARRNCASRFEVLKAVMDHYETNKTIKISRIVFSCNHRSSFFTGTLKRSFSEIPTRFLTPFREFEQRPHTPHWRQLDSNSWNGVRKYSRVYFRNSLKESKITATFQVYSNIYLNNIRLKLFII
jgi:hypothetical protein